MATAAVRKCVEIRCFNLHVYLLSKTCWLPSVKILNLKFSDVEIWRQLVKSTRSKDLFVTHQGAFSSENSKLSNPNLHSRIISLPSQMAGKYDPYDEQTIFQKCTCALAKSAPETEEGRVAWVGSVTSPKFNSSLLKNGGTGRGSFPIGFW